MYIDARKLKSSNQTVSERERDKSHTKQILRDWFIEKADEIVSRTFEIDDIGVVESVGEFIKLIKEAEFTYSLGAYQSSTALIGIASEDLCRFFADSCSQNMDSLTQNNRIDRLHSLGLIDAQTKNDFHKIRQLRNDCLHYNQNFKMKSDADLKNDALESINLLKKVYATIVGATDYSTIDLTKLMKISEAIAHEGAKASNDIKGVYDAQMRMRNIFHAVTGLDLSLNLGHHPVATQSIYTVLDVDLESIPPEISLRDKRNGGIVIVDLSDSNVSHMRNSGIIKGIDIRANLVSVTSGLGTTDSWRLVYNPIKTDA